MGRIIGVCHTCKSDVLEGEGFSHEGHLYHYNDRQCIYALKVHLNKLKGEICRLRDSIKGLAALIEYRLDPSTAKTYEDVRAELIKEGLLEDDKETKSPRG